MPYKQRIFAPTHAVTRTLPILTALAEGEKFEALRSGTVTDPMTDPEGVALTAAVPAFGIPSLPFPERAADLLGRLTDDEKIAMLHQRALAVPRLGIGEFSGGSEGVHGASWRDHEGTGMALIATVFPQPVVSTEHYFDDHPQAHAAALRAGLDSFTDQGGDGTFTATAIRQALDRGLITMADVDRAVRRKLLIRLRLGEFDPDGGPFADAGALGTSQHRELARTAARRSMVLLKNDNAVLPITPPISGEAAIAVLGPLADTLYEDWYSPALPYAVTIADGVKAAAYRVTVDEAAERVRTDLGEFDVFDWGDDVITLRQNGKYLTVTKDGELTVGADKPDGWTVRETFRRIPQPGGDMLLRSTATGIATRLRWDVVADGIASAVARAGEADVAVVVAGNHPMIGAREARDRTTLALPPSMDRLVGEVTAANPRTVLVVMSSYPCLVPQAPAIVWTCHAGQETGHALADLLTGRHAPEGRLPQTWYASDADLPGPLEYDIIKAGWTYQYAPAEPRYPFGHGLTYTRFSYGELKLTGGEQLAARLEVTNTGDRHGTEVVQLYARYRGADRPRRRLCGFGRVSLAPGETRAVEITVPMSRLALWDAGSRRMTVPPGRIEIMAAASSADVRQIAALTVPGDEPVPRDLIHQAAADFDDYENIALVDTTRADGDSVTPANPADRSWLVFKNSIFTERTVAATFRVCCADPGGGRIEARRAWCGSRGPDEGDLLGEVAVPCTGGRYDWTEVTGSLGPADGTGDLYLVLHGPVRLDWFRFGRSLSLAATFWISFIRSSRSGTRARSITTLKQSVGSFIVGWP